MKTHHQKSAIIAAILCAASLAGMALAQEAGSAGTSQAAASDSITALAADSLGLPQVAAGDVPLRGSTFWWVYPGGETVPTPCLPLDFNAAIYQINSGAFLVDQTYGQVLVTSKQLAQGKSETAADAVAVQVQSLVELVTWVQTASTNSTASSMTMSAKPMGSGGFGPLDLTQGGYPYLTIAPSGTNAFSITVFNTNSATYYLEMTPVLANPDYPWQIIANGTPGQTNFAVNAGPFVNEFFRVLMATDNPGQGIAVFIDSPANGATVQ